MKGTLQAGVAAEVTFRVTSEMCPAFDGHIVHRVCATWTLVEYMEVAGRKVLLPHLEPDEEGVGSHASCDHHGPAPVGSDVRVVATARKVTSHELVCETTAHLGHRLIATGRTVQKVYPRTVLERLLARG
jgi:predicted thioesterase